MIVLHKKKYTLPVDYDMSNKSLFIKIIDADKQNCSCPSTTHFYGK